MHEDSIRIYDSLDLRALKALLEYEGCPGALKATDKGWTIDSREGRNLFYREKGNFDWLDLLTVPLWQEIVGVYGDCVSEEALKHVAKVLITKGVLIEADLSALLEGAEIVYVNSGSVLDGFSINS